MLSSLSSITFVLTIVATIVMAATAAIQAARQDFDPFGAVVLAIVTAVGGGTLRDLLMGVTPVFWLIDMTYLSTAVPIGFLTYFIAKRYNKGGGRRLIFLQYLDGIGLALFTLVGTQAALAIGLPIPSAIVLGCITGVAGGMFRDMLCGLQPAILKQDLYATISLAGGAIYVLSRDHIVETSSLVLAFVFMIIVRWMVVYQNSRVA